MQHKRFGAFSSTENPEKLAARVTGGLIASSGVVLFVLAQVFGLVIPVEEFQNFAVNVGNTVSVGMTFAGLAYSLYGQLRAWFIKWAEVKPQ